MTSEANDTAVAAAKVGYNARESAYRANLEVPGPKTTQEHIPGDMFPGFELIWFGTGCR